MLAVWVERNQLALHDQPADHKYKMITLPQNEAGNSLLIITIAMSPDKCLHIFSVPFDYRELCKLRFQESDHGPA